MLICGLAGMSFKWQLLTTYIFTFDILYRYMLKIILSLILGDKLWSVVAMIHDGFSYVG